MPAGVKCGILWMTGMKVIKRDGSSVDYDRSKIVIAIEKANAEVPAEERLDRAGIDAIIDSIETQKRQRILVEDIQDLVEQGLVERNMFHLAKTYTSTLPAHS